MAVTYSCILLLRQFLLTFLVTLLRVFTTTHTGTWKFDLYALANLSFLAKGL